MPIKQLQLSKEQHDWLNGWLELWGAWVYSGRLDKRQSSIIAEFMAKVQPQGYPCSPMCNDDDGLLISHVVDRVLSIDVQAFNILLSYYVYKLSKRAIANHYHRTCKRRRMTTKGGGVWKKPSLGTCRNEIDDILNASQCLLYEPLLNAFKCRAIEKKNRKYSNFAIDFN